MRLRCLERGDTIIEVMIAVAVLGLAFSISYATANHALQTARNSQEHGEALQYLNSQVELARAYATNPSVDETLLYDSSHTLCMDSKTSDVATFGDPVPASNAACSIGNIPYQVSYTYSPAPDTNAVSQDVFTFTVTWPGLGELGTQKETMSYKIHPPVTGPGAGGLGLGGGIGGGLGLGGGSPPPPPPPPPPSPLPPPSITLAAAPLTVWARGFSTLSWTTANASGCTAGGGTWSGPQNTSGSWTTPPLSTTTTYTLSCTGAGGSASKSVTVNVTCLPWQRFMGLCT